MNGEALEGILLIDKPAGPTSHDVVARLRAVTGQRRVGHAGTLDPLATGLLVILLGRATRLASLLTSGSKSYVADVHLGVATETGDSEGIPLAAMGGPLPSDADLAEALDDFRGSFDQRPPEHSAKKVGGRKAYDLARRNMPVVLAPVRVTVAHLAMTGREAATVRLELTVSAGFYVRALARDLGERLGCGAHLTGLRRTHSGTFSLDAAIGLEDAERLGRALEDRVVTPAEALPDLPAVHLSEAGVTAAGHGSVIGPALTGDARAPLPAGSSRVRLLAPDGRLVALAESRGGALHPVVVLG